MSSVLELCDLFISKVVLIGFRSLEIHMYHWNEIITNIRHNWWLLYSLMIKNDMHKSLRFFKMQISWPYEMAWDTSYPHPILQLRASPKINKSQLPSSLHFFKTVDFSLPWLYDGKASVNINSIHSNTSLKTKTNEKQSLIIEKSMKIILTSFIDLHSRMTVTAVTGITFPPVIVRRIICFPPLYI